MSELEPILRHAERPEAEPIESYYAQTEDIPSVSFDRSLSHFAFNTDIDMQALHDFYYGLPHLEKLPLNRLHIHFSSSKPVEGLSDTKINGDFSSFGTKHIGTSSRGLSPELDLTDKPTIRIYVGSAMPELYKTDEYRDTSKTWLSTIVSEEISETLAHELTHFAQKSETEIQPPTRVESSKTLAIYFLARTALAVMYNWKDIGVGIGVSALAETLSGGGIRSVVTGLGATSLSYTFNRRDRKLKLAQDEFKHYKAREHEVDAREHEDDAPVMCTVSLHHFRNFPDGHKLEDFIKPLGDRSGLYQANFNHRTLAYTPKGKDPKQVRNSASVGEIKSTLTKSRIKKPKKK